MSTNKQSYVLIFTLSIMTLITVITFQLMHNVFVGTNFDKTMINREHAEMLALGGINLAISQLTIREEQKNKDQEIKDESQKPNEKVFKQFLKRILPHLNRWQVFTLNEKYEGFAGEIKLCITSEDGKININEAFDFEKKEFKQEYKKLLESLSIRGKTANGEILKKLTAFFKKRNKKIDDISQIQEVLPQLDIFFYEPPVRTKKQSKAFQNQRVALQDLFTICSSNGKIEPLFLSDSVCSIFRLKRPKAYDSEKMKTKFKHLIEKLTPDTTQNTDEHWNILKPIYNKTPQGLDNYKNIFSPKFEPKVYSVLSSGKVDNVEQRLLAIIKKVDISQKENQQEKIEVKKEKGKDKKPLFPKQFKILKIYWL